MEDRALNQRGQWADQGKKTWNDKARKIKGYYFFCSTMGNSVGGASIVYTTLESPWYLDLVSCVVSCTSIYGLCFDPFWLNEHFEMRRPSITWPGFSPASLNNSVSQVSNQWFSKNSRVHSTHIYWIHVPGVLLGIGNTALNKRGTVSALMELTVCLGRQAVNN